MYSCCRLSAPVPALCLPVSVCVPEYTSTCSLSSKSLCTQKEKNMTLFQCYFLRMLYTAVPCVFFQKSHFSELSSDQIWEADNKAAWSFSIQESGQLFTQIAFHFSSQYLNGLGHFSFAQTAMFFPRLRLCLSSAMPMSSLLIFGSAFEERVVQNYKYSLDFLLHLWVPVMVKLVPLLWHV